MKILYVGFYDRLRDGRKIRNFSLAAAKKMDYIADCLVRAGHEVEIVSPAYYEAEDVPAAKEVHDTLRPGVTLTLPPSFPAKSKPARVRRVLSSRLWLFRYLCRHADRGTPVLAYHHYDTAIALLAARALRHFPLTVEVEEKYAMVWHISPWKRLKERMLLRHARRRAISVSERLSEKLGLGTVPVCYGNYTLCERERLPSPGGQTQLVFSGLIDRARGGAFLAMDAMRHLPPSYTLALSGAVSPADDADFRAALTAVNDDLGREAVHYDGVLDDAAYETLLLSSDIALNPQRAGGYGEYLFPSKLLTYLTHGLPVVTTRGESITASALSDLFTYAEDFTPEAVAQAILAVRPLPRDVIRERLNALGQAFTADLSAILTGH